MANSMTQEQWWALQEQLMQFCKRGHDLTLPDSIYCHPHANKHQCKQCRREYCLRYQVKKKLAAKGN